MLLPPPWLKHLKHSQQSNMMKTLSWNRITQLFFYSTRKKLITMVKSFPLLYDANFTSHNDLKKQGIETHCSGNEQLHCALVKICTNTSFTFTVTVSFLLVRVWQTQIIFTKTKRCQSSTKKYDPSGIQQQTKDRNVSLLQSQVSQICPEWTLFPEKSIKDLWKKKIFSELLLLLPHCLHAYQGCKASSQYHWDFDFSLDHKVCHDTIPCVLVKICINTMKHMISNYAIVGQQQ